MTAVDTFTAVAECPRCHRWDVHWMRNPHMVSKREWMSYEIALTEWELIEDNERHEMKTFGGATVRTVWRVPPPKKPQDESDYEVIRICKCGNEWGQA